MTPGGSVLTGENLLLLACISSGSLAGFVYMLWVVYWLRMQRFLLALLNGIIAVASFAVATAFVVIMLGGDISTQVTIRPWMPILLLAPVVTRWLELIRQEGLEAFARAANREMLGNGGGAQDE